MVYFDAAKIDEAVGKWKSSRTKTSIRLFLESIAAMETELRALPKV